MTVKNSCERCGEPNVPTQPIAEDTYHYKNVCEYCYKQHTNPPQMLRNTRQRMTLDILING